MQTCSVSTRSRTHFVDITDQVQRAVSSMAIENGFVTVFVPHTTAGITLNENADPDVTRDMEAALDAAVPWRANYAHAEGNSAAHVKASMMGFSLHLLVADGRLMLGRWQAVYFCEFDGPRTRTVLVKG